MPDMVLQPSLPNTQAMEMKHRHVRTIPLKCAPSQAPCPTCGKLGKRKDILHRQVRTIAYKQVVCLDITDGEYRARCDCCTTFRATPPGVEPRALYDKGFAGSDLVASSTLGDHPYFRSRETWQHHAKCQVEHPPRSASFG